MCFTGRKKGKTTKKQKGDLNMVKGIQRRFVEMKLSGSKAFESAYFILRQSSEAEKRSESELIDEARRIVGTLEPQKRKNAGKLIGRLLLSLLFVVIGAVVGFLLSLLFLG
jgi:pilus assembly protein TadC